IAPRPGLSDPGHHLLRGLAEQVAHGLLGCFARHHSHQSLLGDELHHFLDYAVAADPHPVGFEALRAAGVLPQLVAVRVLAHVGGLAEARAHVVTGGLLRHQAAGGRAAAEDGGQQGEQSQKSHGMASGQVECPANTTGAPVIPCETVARQSRYRARPGTGPGRPNSRRQTSASAATPWWISSWLGLAKQSRSRLRPCAGSTDHWTPGLIATPASSAAW